MSDTTVESTPLDLVIGLYAKDELVRALGITIVRVEPGRVELELDPSADALNGHDMVHGGVLFILADTAFAYAFASRGRPGVTTQGEIAYLAPAEAGTRLRAVTTEVHRADPIGIYDVLITDENGTGIASFRGQGRVPRQSAG